MVGLRNRNFATFFAIALLPAAWGCQSNSMTSTPWNQPTRVPPPNAPSNLPSAPYSTPMGAGAAMPGQGLPGQGIPGQASPKSVSAYSNSPLTEAVAAAQNDLRIATDNARSAIEKSANSITSGVSQAGAQIDRVGTGVVQASQVLEASFQEPVPLPPSSLPPGSLPPASTGSINDLTSEPSAEANSPWRKPVPR